jgi:hypothetical protein
MVKVESGDGFLTIVPSPLFFKNAPGCVFAQ